MNESPEGSEETTTPIDFSAASLYLSGIPEELEKKWSDALEMSEIQEGLEQMNRRLNSILQVIVRQTEQNSKEAEPTELSFHVDQFPPSFEWVSDLETNAEPRTRHKQLVISHLYVTVSLADLVKSAQKPHVRRINLLNGETESWWDSGAFNRLAQATRLLSRLSEEIEDSIAAAKDPNADREAKNTWDLYITLATQALNSGMPEASISYALVAIKEILKHKVGTESDVDAVKGLESLPRFHLHTKIVSLGRDISSTLSAGDVPDVSIVIPIANGLMHIFNELIYANFSEEEKEKIISPVDESTKD